MSKKSNRQQKIQRNSDKKWLVDAVNDTWTDDETQATLFNLLEEVQTEAILVRRYRYPDFDVFDISN